MLAQLQTLENLADYMERRVNHHLRNGNFAESIKADETARAHRREINRLKDASAIAP